MTKPKITVVNEDALIVSTGSECTREQMIAAGWQWDEKLNMYVIRDEPSEISEINE